MEGYKVTEEMQFVLLQKLSFLWSQYPTLRLGQLISCVVKDEDLFTVYDEKLLALLEAFDNEHTTTTR